LALKVLVFKNIDRQMEITNTQPRVANRIMPNN